MEVPLFERCIYHFFRRGTLETPCPSSKFWNGGGGLLARNSIVEKLRFCNEKDEDGCSPGCKLSYLLTPY